MLGIAPIIAAVTGTAISGAALLLAASEGATVGGTEQRLTLDCHGGPAMVEGVDNQVTITGDCASLSVSGTDNIVRIALVPGARITVSGVDNAVYWTAPGNSRPRIAMSGVDNVVRRAP